ncbi:hypothetical protein BGZ65_011904, partial [Modicella reniformis]
MVESSSVTNPAPVIDWADDTDEEIDFDAPVFSDDEDLLAANAAYLSAGRTDEPVDNEHRDATLSSSSARYTSGSADRSNRSQDRRTEHDSSSWSSSNRIRPRNTSAPYRDPPSRHSDFSGSRDHRSSAGRSSGGSYEREGYRRSEDRRDPRANASSAGSRAPQADEGSNWGKHSSDRGSGQQPTRQLIPLPPKPAAAAATAATVALDVNHPSRSIDRSRSPSY